MNRILIVVIAFVCLLTCVEARTWTHKKSGQKIIGDFVEFSGKDIKIKVTAGPKKGKIVNVSIFELSKEDREWLKKKEAEIQQERKVPKSKAKGVEDLEEDNREKDVKEEVKEKGSNMVMNLGWCILILAEFLFIMSGMKSGFIRGVIAAVPCVGWVIFAMLEWQNAKTPFLIGLVGLAVVAGGYVMGGGII